MVILNNNRELQSFIEKKDFYIDFLIEKLNKFNIKGNSIDDFENRIDEIENFYHNYYSNFNEEERKLLQLSFWAFFSTILINKLGGKLQIAPKSDYCAGTPQLVDFGNRYNKNGKRQWIGIGFDSWFNGVVQDKLLGSLDGTVKHVIDYYK
ncbi:hypothetical protein EQP59_02820 [Ornithobacterium rhinotracheale]|uniref:Uncharacterized protein n=1 Tax=Ornithobacterium rhinotracheale TaxID=28251 RepID=A0A410JQK6_ORNRH|nr:hypothetical protein [Ornithobacterium rhinotracheale]MRJ09001.1 hypothetical protein [Ornithobacterium rhinotracheale]QAR30361.1 hypothetical protein EQP59_02820 [Ornithobacterium rhinotracheale]UOH77193.1 hypothetical protein MT996_08215 [Ornithobacterium rhinotracheale]